MATESTSAEAGVSGALERVFGILDVELLLRSDDPDFIDEFHAVFDAGGPSSAPRSRLIATVTTKESSGTISVTGDDLESPADFLLGFSSPTIPIREVPSELPEWRLLAVGEDPEAVFRFMGDRCEFRKTKRWRRVLAHYLFLRALRHRPDLLLFHAGSVALVDCGVMIVGPKGAGKTTLSLSLAARGWNFLGDEMAAYEPSSGMLLPLRRPVGVKPGPRSERIDRALREASLDSDEDGIIRAPLERLFPIGPPAGVPLRNIIFLQGFAPQPELTKIKPGRPELSVLQPIATSLATLSPTKRVFEMVKLLASVQTYQLVSGEPDQTADLIERTFRE